MNNHQIKLKSVYSCPADEIPKDINLPDGWTLSWHQLETLKALRNRDIDVVINTAMTGDGKSLAAYLEVLQGNYCAIGLYPTNELARDQETQTKGYIEKFQPEDEPRVTRLSSADLEIYAENEGLKKSSALSTRTHQSEVVLTNPDIFHYLHRGTYLIPGDSPDKLWGRIDKDFDLFILDEFHVFAAPQIASVINTMLLIRFTNRGKKFLFLSATPDEQLIEKLEIAGFRCKVINPLQEDKYKFPDTRKEEEELISQKWRQVSRPISLNFIPLEANFQSSEIWLKENSNLILEYFQSYPGSKGAIILNSIAAVKRLVPFFHELFKEHNLTVGENTGLSGKTQKELSLAADLVLGTSTIDVGVDFKINFLVFESADAGNFIQRLGRLGRHDGYYKDGEDIKLNIKFHNYTAYALIPKFLTERLFAGNSPPLQPNATYNRPFFHNAIAQNYRQINDFRGYYRRWAGIQSIILSWQLQHKTIKEQYAGSVKVFSQTCEKVFNTRLNRAAACINGWRTTWNQDSGKKGNPIVEEASSFRGSSSLLCGIYDLTEENEIDRFKTYDLPGIVANLDIEMWTETAFLKTLRETASRIGKPIPKGRFNNKYCLGFMKLRNYREERLNWKFIYPENLQPIADTWKVQVLTGIQIWQPDNSWISEINKKLKKQGLVSYVIHYPVTEIRMRSRLPMHFQIYPICDQYSINDATAPYSIAFGQSALLLDTLAYRFKGKGDQTWIC